MNKSAPSNSTMVERARTHEGDKGKKRQRQEKTKARQDITRQCHLAKITVETKKGKMKANQDTALQESTQDTTLS